MMLKRWIAGECMDGEWVSLSLEETKKRLPIGSLKK